MMMKKNIAILLLWAGAGSGLYAQEVVSLESARELALKHSRKARQASLEVQAAAAGLEGVKAAAKPVVDGSVAAFHAGKPLNTLLPGFGVSPSLTVTQPVYAGGKIRLGRQAAEKGIKIQEERLALTETEVLVKTEEAYWQMVSVKEKIRLATRHGVLLDSLHAELTNLYDAGMIYKNDLLKVEVQRNDAQLGLEKAKDGLVLARLNLARIIGKPEDAVFVVADSVSGNFFHTDTLLTRLQPESRPELRLLKSVTEAEEIRGRLLKAELNPTVAVVAGGFMGIGKHMNFTNGGNVLTSYLGMLSVNIPLWDWGQKSSKVREQAHKTEASRLEQDETLELLNLELRKIGMELGHAAKKVAYSEASLRQAAENLRLSNDRFKEGTVTGKDVLEAQVLWQEAYSNQIDAKVAYKLQEMNYRRATGILR